MLTESAIRKIAPKARQDYVDALVNGAEHFARWNVTTPERQKAFLANICAETGGLTLVRENTAWTEKNLAIFSKGTANRIRPFVGDKIKSANAAYGHRMGNERNGTNDDDGWRFRGGGLIQLTGKDNYERAGKAIGVPLGEHPELIEDARVSLQAALWEFSKFNNYADRGESGFRAVCNGINRGNPLSSLEPIGWDHRLDWYGKCKAVIGTSAAGEDILEVGDSGAMVKAIQERLLALGYAVGKVDGVFGSRTRAQVLAFQAENDLVTDGKVGQKTRAALNSDSAKPMPVGERALATKADLKAAGSTTLQATDAIKSTVKVVGTATTTVAVADQTGLLDSGSKLLADLQQYKGVASGMAEVLTWSLGHWYYFVPLGCYLIYRWANSIEGRRILKYKLGLDLSL